MPLIFYVVFGGFIFGAGQVMSPKPEVVLVKDGVVVETAKALSPIMVIADGQDVQVRGAKGGLTFNRAPITAPKSTAPFYRDVYGNWTAECQKDCGDER